MDPAALTRFLAPDRTKGVCQDATVIVRDALPEDYPVFARLFLELKVPDPTPSPEIFAARIVPAAFVLCDGGAPIAYAWWNPFGKVARVTHVVVDPSARGRGIGRALMTELGARAIAAGCSSWTLYVKPDNAPAIRLYEWSGMRVAARATAMKIRWADVAGLEGDAADVRVATAADDAGIDAAFDLPPGQVALFRAQGRVILCAGERGEVVAYAAFDPAFPGAMPFRVKRPGLVLPLLDAMHAHARPEHDHVRMTAEDGDAVTLALRQAGGEVVLEILRMAGPIAVGSAGRVA
jgi:ribosomal protein S18 acetylase RimI-like enzyme